ncbi:hypothetical protein [Nodosilinea nodulosa]|uniref:hypothetical protein n=1 Tax=Nodosilinea nodulosa TaxID=416001 RepID=UPI00035D81A5|nr:hypothetical protein [Nodosilinea nodulosa]
MALDEQEYELMRWLANKYPCGIESGHIHWVLALREFVGTTFSMSDLSETLGLNVKRNSVRLRELKQKGLIFYEIFYYPDHVTQYTLYWVITRPDERCPEYLVKKARQDRLIAVLIHPQHGKKNLYNGKVARFCKKYKLTRTSLTKLINCEISHHKEWRLFIKD